MKFKLRHASNFDQGEEVEIKTLEELLSLSDAVKNDLIICRQEDKKQMPEIIVYDDYME
jgi:hypothetical protein